MLSIIGQQDIRISFLAAFLLSRKMVRLYVQHGTISCVHASLSVRLPSSFMDSHNIDVNTVCQVGKFLEAVTMGICVPHFSLCMV